MSKNNMASEVLSNKQNISLITLFLIGSSAILGVGTTAKQDVWIVILIAMGYSLPVLLIYSRLNHNHPGMDLYDIIEKLMGKIFGRFIILLYIWYSFHLGSLVIRNFTEFIQVVSLTETPKYSIAIMAVICIIGVRFGLEVLGRFSEFVFPYIIATILGLIILSIPNMEVINIKPILYSGVKPLLKTAFYAFSFPFAEAVIFTLVFKYSPQKGSILKPYFLGVLFSGFILLFVSLRNILVLGSEIATSLYFPSYSAVSLINIGDFFQRIEVLLSISFIFVGFIKISICLLVSCKGIAKLLQIEDYKPLGAPIGLLMISMSLFIYDNVVEMLDWAKNVYPYYAIPFQIIIPLLLLVLSEIRMRIKSKDKNTL